MADYRFTHVTLEHALMVYIMSASILLYLANTVLSHNSINPWNGAGLSTTV